jgi:hypothetical protein
VSDVDIEEHMASSSSLPATKKAKGNKGDAYPVFSKPVKKGKLEDIDDGDEKVDDSKMEEVSSSVSPLPNQPKACADARPICEKDEKCKRKSPSHFRDFSHPIKQQNDYISATERAHEDLISAKKMRDEMIAEASEEADRLRDEFLEKARGEAQSYFSQRVKKIKQQQKDAYEDIEKTYKA